MHPREKENWIKWSRDFTKVREELGKLIKVIPLTLKQRNKLSDIREDLEALYYQAMPNLED